MKKTLIITLFFCTCIYAQSPGGPILTGAVAIGGGGGGRPSPFFNGLLAANRAIDWTGAGAVIPFVTTPCATQPTILTGSGNAVANRTAINNAIIADAGGASPCVINIASGTYFLSGSLMLGYGSGKGNVVLRGAGSNSTFFTWNGVPSSNCNGLQATYICMWNTDGSSNAGSNPWPNNTSISSGYSKGSTALVLGGHNNLKVGSEIQIAQSDPLTDNGNAWFCGQLVCSWTGSTSSPRLSGVYYSESQLLTVSSCGTAIFGAACTSNNITITPGIYAPNWNAGQTPTAFWSNTLPAYNMGIENISFDISSAGSGTPTLFTEIHDCSNCWISGVRQINGVTSPNYAEVHIMVWQSNHVTIQSNYMYGSNPASSGYGVDFAAGTSDSLAQNNIGQHMPTAFITETAVGVVFEANFAVDNFFGSNWQQCDQFHHSAGDYYQLREMNQGICATEDDFHGTSLWDTWHRNAFSGYDPNTGTPPASNKLSINDMFGARYHNYVGNVIGYGGATSIYQYIMSSVSDCGSGNDGMEWAFDDSNQNVASAQDCGFGYNIRNDVATNARPSASSMRWGNWDFFNSTVRTVAGENGAGATVYPALNSPSSTWSLYPSLFNVSKPVWFGTVPWPAIGPDVTGGDINNSGGFANNIPASNCYHNTMGGLDNGTSGALAFDSNNCYPSGNVLLTFTEGSTTAASNGNTAHGNIYTNCAESCSGGVPQPPNSGIVSHGTLWCNSSEVTSCGGFGSGFVTSTRTNTGVSLVENGQGAGGTDSLTNIVDTIGGSNTGGCPVGTNLQSLISNIILPGSIANVHEVFGANTASSGFNSSSLAVRKLTTVELNNMTMWIREECSKVNTTSVSGEHYEWDTNYNDTSGNYIGMGMDFNFPTGKLRYCIQGCASWSDIRLVNMATGAITTTLSWPSNHYIYKIRYEHRTPGCTFSSSSDCLFYDIIGWQDVTAGTAMVFYRLQDASTHLTPSGKPVNKTTWTRNELAIQHQWDVNGASAALTADVEFDNFIGLN